MSVLWNPWHGCHKISPGCAHCYVYRADQKYEKDSSVVVKNSTFSLPVRRSRKGDYKIPPGETVYTCFTSDFFVEDADGWRTEIWDMIRERDDLCFFFITKRIHRFFECVPPDWGTGWPHLGVGCTVENQERADARLPLFLKAPICQKTIICSPLLEAIDLSPYLNSSIRQVVAAGESGPEARVCEYDWVLDLRRQCREKGIAFHYQQTGARLKKDGRLYFIPRRLQHAQARKANIDLR